MKPIPDKAEVALEYPDKLYIGTFEQSARFDAHFDETGVSLTLHRSGDESVRKSVRMHIHYALFAEILSDLAKTASVMPASDVSHRTALATAAQALGAALKTKKSARTGQHASTDEQDLTAADEVRLLHVLE
jgi:hypothetical protein